MIHRRTFKASTVGSRKTKNLRPDITLPHGLNSKTLMYDEPHGTCILEVWCSDHELLKAEDRKTLNDIDALSSQESINETLKSHNLSPATLGLISVSGHKFSTVFSAFKNDVSKRKLTIKGLVRKFLKLTSKQGYILDEG